MLSNFGESKVTVKGMPVSQEKRDYILKDDVSDSRLTDLAPGINFVIVVMDGQH